MQGRRIHPGLICLMLLALAAGCRSSAPASRVVVIGLDGATWDLLDPWIEEGDLPNLEALGGRGAVGILQSVFPPMSPPAWGSAITGKNPGKHGIYDFWIRPPGATAPVPATSLDRRSEAVWQILSRRNRRVGIINVPLTDPPDQVNGFMIAGFPHLDAVGYTHPQSLASRLRGYELDAFGEVLIEGQEGALRDRLTRTFEARAQAALSLMDEEDWDLFWVVFTGADKMQHFFWRFADPEHPYYDEEKARTFGTSIRDFWRRVDRVVGEIVNRIDEDTVVMVISDHGFGPTYREIRIRNWLIREGFVDLDKNQVHAYYQGDFGGRIYLNVAGREPYGQVEPGQSYRRLRGEIADRLMDLTDPETGVRPVTEVRFAEEVYSGPYLDEAPDILFTVLPGYFAVGGGGEPGAPVFALPSYTFSAYHRRDGILALAGKPIRREVNVTPQRIEGVTPTILYLLGEPVSADMDGVVFTEALTPACLVAHEIKFAEPVALSQDISAEAEALLERRRMLESVPYIR